MGLALCKFELWALWCANGGEVRKTSQLGKMMESKGHLTFGTAGGSKDPDCIESRIEELVAKLHFEDPKNAEILRVHFGAKDFRDLKKTAGAKAKKCGVSLSMYYRRLNAAKKFVDLQLSATR